MRWITGTTIANSSTTSVSFSNIPQTFDHLELRVVSRTMTGSGTHDWLYIYHPNNVVGSGAFGTQQTYGDGSSVYTTGATNQYSAFCGYNTIATHTANIFGAAIINIWDYASTSKHKVFTSIYGFDRNGAGEVGQTSNVAMNLGNTALTGFEIGLSGGYYFAPNTQIDLYGYTSTHRSGY